MREAHSQSVGHRLGHGMMILGVAILHIACYKLVNELTRWASLPIHNYSLIIDEWIPYLGWTWIFYYFGDIYIFLGAGIIVWKLSDRKFHRAVYMYVVMILTGAFLELIFASESPWPSQMIALQKQIHSAMRLDLYASLPSMHVALTIFPTSLAFSVFRSRWLKSILVLLATLITISTMSFKEHVFLDAAAGAFLAFACYVLWRREGKRRNSLETGKSHET